MTAIGRSAPALSGATRVGLAQEGIERIEESPFLAMPDPDLPECDPSLK